MDFGIDAVPVQLGANDAAFESVNIFINATDGVISNPPELSKFNNTVSNQSINPFGNVTTAMKTDATFGIGQIGLILLQQ